MSEYETDPEQEPDVGPHAGETEDQHHSPDEEGTHVDH